MSYFFNVRAATKAEAKALVATEFHKVIATQLVHMKDRDAAIANAAAVIDLLDDDTDGREIHVTCNGYMSWCEVDNFDAPKSFSGASISANASYVSKTA